MYFKNDNFRDGLIFFVNSMTFGHKKKHRHHCLGHKKTHSGFKMGYKRGTKHHRTSRHHTHNVQRVSTTDTGTTGQLGM